MRKLLSILLVFLLSMSLLYACSSSIETESEEATVQTSEVGGQELTEQNSAPVSSDEVMEDEDVETPENVYGSVDELEKGYYIKRGNKFYPFKSFDYTPIDIPFKSPGYNIFVEGSYDKYVNQMHPGDDIIYVSDTEAKPDTELFRYNLRCATIGIITMTSINIGRWENISEYNSYGNAAELEIRNNPFYKRACKVIRFEDKNAVEYIKKSKAGYFFDNLEFGKSYKVTCREGTKTVDYNVIADLWIFNQIGDGSYTHWEVTDDGYSILAEIEPGSDDSPTGLNKEGYYYLGGYLIYFTK